eukprot:3174350-Rhodomonas_salina.1
MTKARSEQSTRKPTLALRCVLVEFEMGNDDTRERDEKRGCTAAIRTDGLWVNRCPCPRCGVERADPPSMHATC